MATNINMNILGSIQRLWGASIPVLCYHQVRPASGMSPEKFGQHLDLLHTLGLRTITLNQLLKVIQGQEKLNFPAMVITFDDCTLDNWIYAVPQLLQRQMVAVFFAITDFIHKGPVRLRADETKNPQEVPSFEQLITQALAGNTQGFMTHEEIKILVHDLGMEVYSHSAAHQACFTSQSPTLKPTQHWSHGPLTGHINTHQGPMYPVGSAYAHEGFGLNWQGQPLQLSTAKERLDFCIADFSRSKQALESLLNQPCPFLCLPWGAYDTLTLDAAQQAGYAGLLTLKRSYVGYQSDPMTMGRLAVKDKKSLAWLKWRTLALSTKVSAQVLHGQTKNKK